jgi:hypothetical protein
MVNLAKGTCRKNWCASTKRTKLLVPIWIGASERAKFLNHFSPVRKRVLGYANSC